MALTQAAVERLKPDATKRLEVPDGLLGSLYLVIQPSGQKSFAVRFRHHGKPVKLTLGSHPALTLATARALGRDALIAAKQGRNPAAERKEERRKAASAAHDTLQAIGEKYLRRREAEGMRSAGQLRATFERAVFPALGARPIADIRPRDIVRMLDGIEEERGPSAADAARVALGTMMNWHASRDDDFLSPMKPGWARADTKARRRKRVLSDSELRAVWKAAEASKEPFAAMVRFILLTAARRNEAADMLWSEIHGADWVIPAHRHKTGVAVGELVRPLSGAAVALLAGMPRIGDEFVFSTSGVRPIAHFAHFKNRFDAAVLDELRKQDPKAQPLPRWTLHDLRRTARTLMSRARVDVDYAERCLGHVMGAIRGTYDIYAYRDEKAEAYEKLAAQIDRIVNPTDNVRRLQRGR